MINTEDMIKIDRLSQSDICDVDYFIPMASQAEDFLIAQDWCRTILQGYLDRGVGGIIAVFYYEIVPVEADPAVWVIVGDVPPAYMDIVGCRSGEEALESYIYCMREWVLAVEQGKSVEGLIPVYYAASTRILPPTRESANQLKSRLDYLEREIVPWCRQGLYRKRRN